MTDQEAIAAEILRQAGACGRAASISPNDVARALAPDEAEWRRLLGPVRAAALRLAREGRFGAAGYAPYTLPRFVMAGYFV